MNIFEKKGSWDLRDGREEVHEGLIDDWGLFNLKRATARGAVVEKGG